MTDEFRLPWFAKSPLVGKISPSVFRPSFVKSEDAPEPPAPESEGPEDVPSVDQATTGSGVSETIPDRPKPRSHKKKPPGETLRAFSMPTLPDAPDRRDRLLQRILPVFDKNPNMSIRNVSNYRTDFPGLTSREVYDALVSAGRQPTRSRPRMIGHDPEWQQKVVNRFLRKPGEFISNVSREYKLTEEQVIEAVEDAYAGGHLPKEVYDQVMRKWKTPWQGSGRRRMQRGNSVG